jgi:hypothetical protein
VNPRAGLAGIGGTNPRLAGSTRWGLFCDRAQIPTNAGTAISETARAARHDRRASVLSREIHPKNSSQDLRATRRILRNR